MTIDYRELGRTKMTDIETEDFLYLENIKYVFRSDNIVNIPTDVGQILYVFEEKMLKKIETTKKYTEEFKNILKEDIDCAYNDIVEELKSILNYKLIELNTKIVLQHYIRNPITQVEKMALQAIIDNIIKEYSYNYIEELSDLLVISWLIIEERAYEEMKAEDLAKSKANNKKQ